MAVWVADFETESELFYKKYGYTQTWLTYIENLDTDENFMSITIKDFVDFIISKANETRQSQHVYFHNLSFDGSFLLYYLMNNDYVIETVINDMKVIYEIKIVLGDSKRNIYFRCSYLIFSCSVSSLPFSTKTSIDYEKIRNYKSLSEIPEIEKDYIKQDVQTVKRNLKILQDEEGIELNGRFKTIASISYSEMKAMTSKAIESKGYVWNWFYPQIDIETDEFVRESYKGGYVYLNPKYQDKLIEEKVCSWDRVSSYPSVMMNEYLPSGKPYKTRTRPSKKFLYIVAVKIAWARIKEGYMPFISINRQFRFIKEIYPEQIEDVVIHMTSIDFEMFKEYYDSEFEEVEYLVFKQKTKNFFNDYIMKQYTIKRDTKAIIKNKEKYSEEEVHKAIFHNFWAKLKLNSPYGKFGTNPRIISCYPYFDEEGKIAWREEEEIKEKNNYYIPLATFITAYGRLRLIEQIQANKERFVYCDTDSLHLLGTETPSSLNDKLGNELNKWEFEGISYKSKYLKAKQYLKLKMKDDELQISRTIASLSKSEHHKVNFENFHLGSVIESGRKSAKNVKGGRIIIPQDFTFK